MNDNMSVSENFPDDWELVPLKFSVSSIETGKRDSSFTPTEEDCGVLSIGGEHFNKWGEWKLESPRYISQEMYQNLRKGIVHKGDVLMVKDGATIGKVAYVDKIPEGDAAVNSHVYVLKSSDLLSGKLLSYILQSSWVQAQIGSLIRGSAQAGLPATFADNVRIPIPPKDTQKQMLIMLDCVYKNTREGINKAEKLDLNLQNKKLSTLTSLVTNGLRDHKTQKVGVQWFERLPSHWNPIKVKFVLNDIDQGWSPQCQEVPSKEEEWGVLKTGCVNDMDFKPSENKKLPNNLAPKPELEVESGDILMSRANTRELVGSCAIVEDNPKKLIFSDKLYRLSLNDSMMKPKYFVYAMNAAPSREQIELDASGASQSMVNISQQFVRSMWIPHPPIKEQNEIIEYLDKKMTVNADLRNALSKLSTLFTEKNRSIITKAITGQIDLTD